MNSMKKILGFLVAVWALPACTMLSFYPLYTEDVLVRDDRIIGTWVSLENVLFNSDSGDSLFWEITFPETIKEYQTQQNFSGRDTIIPNTFTYKLKVYDPSDPDSQAEFNLHLVQLGNGVFVDFFPEDWEESYGNMLLALHLMGVHTFAKIEVGEHLQINWFAPGLLESLIEENRIRIRHVSNGAYTLLTAEPAELQQFVIRYAGNEEAFSDGLDYRLIRIDN